MSFEWFVASRYLRAKGRSRFRSLITVLAVGGVALGVAASIVVLGVMNGFSKEVRSRIVGTNAPESYRATPSTSASLKK